MPEQVLASQSAAGALSRGGYAARHATGKMLRTIGAKGAGVASRSPSGRIGASAKARSPIGRRSPASKMGTITRTALVKRSPSGLVGTLSKAKGSLSGKAVASLLPTYLGKHPAAKRTIAIHKLEPERISIPERERVEYQGPVFLGPRKRSAAAYKAEPEIFEKLTLTERAPEYQGPVFIGGRKKTTVTLAIPPARRRRSR